MVGEVVGMAEAGDVGRTARGRIRCLDKNAEALSFAGRRA